MASFEFKGIVAQEEVQSGTGAASGLLAEYQAGAVQANTVGYLDQSGTLRVATMFYNGDEPEVLLDAVNAAKSRLGPDAADTFRILGGPAVRKF